MKRTAPISTNNNTTLKTSEGKKPNLPKSTNREKQQLFSILAYKFQSQRLVDEMDKNNSMLDAQGKNKGHKSKHNNNSKKNKNEEEDNDIYSTNIFIK